MQSFDIFKKATANYAEYLWHALTEPGWMNYVYLLLGVSLAVWLLELAFPWRKNQPKFRRDFWLDGFYMFFNFFGFSLLGYHGVASVIEHHFSNAREALGLAGTVIDVSPWPSWLQLLMMLVFRDFLHYWLHRVLHRVPAFWNFHKVHHSVKQMGFAAHLRYHLFETVFYRTLEYIPLGLVGFGVEEFFLVHAFALTIGHLNHANLHLPIGLLRYVLNSPQMHLWHHAKDMPRRHGASFGLTFSVWDWLFGTVYWPKDDPDVELGFDGDERYQTGFFGHLLRPFQRPPG